MATILHKMARSIAAIKGVKVKMANNSLLVNLPVPNKRRQTVKVTGMKVGGCKKGSVVARIISRAGFIEDHKIIRKLLEFNSGNQGYGLCVDMDSDPPAVDAVASVPIDLTDENLTQLIWKKMHEVSVRADILEQQLSDTDEL